MPEYIVGVDIGTTAVKGALFDSGGVCIRERRVTYPTTRHSATEVIQNPDDWLQATQQILQYVCDSVPPAAIAGICLCGQTNTHAFVDAEGKPVFPAITWQDTRCDPQARRLDAQLTDEQRRRWWGSDVHIAASHTISRMAWLAEQHPDLWRRVACVLTPKDYCLLHLTGQRVSDALSCFDLVDLKGLYIADLIDQVHGAHERLPPLLELTATAGTYTRQSLTNARTPMMTGTMDGWASMFGTGVAGPGEGAYLSGTSEIVILCSDRRMNTPGIVSFMPVNGWHVHAGPTQSGADSLRWFADILGRPIEALLALAAGVDRARARVLFLPHLQGERAPLWDSNSRGAFLGLTGSMGAADFSLGVLEGVALSAKLLFDEAVKAASHDYSRLFLAGGGAQSDLWCQIRADVLGVELQRAAYLDAGVLGAAIIAAVGTGVYSDLSAAIRSMTRAEVSFSPDPRHADRYAEALELYKSAYRGLRDINRRLA
ncbi:MAG: carbohydrate kinase [Proteobacteria bacterium]|nr:carbohydrate kinase [Pseudomonadota bacterium]